MTFADEYAHGASGLLAYARAKYVTDLGATLPAASAQQILVGIETLDLRMRKISADAAELAGRLLAAPEVARVHHPALPERPDRHLVTSCPSGFIRRVGGLVETADLQPALDDLDGL